MTNRDSSDNCQVHNLTAAEHASAVAFQTALMQQRDHTEPAEQARERHRRKLRAKRAQRKSVSTNY